MRIAVGASVLGLALLGASTADAGWFKSGDKLPRAIDSPIVRPKLKETHKVWHHLRSRLKQDAPGWGAQWNQIFRLPETQPTGHYNR
jgi:hypothetical protein